MLDTKALAAGLLKTMQDWLTPTFKAIDQRFLGIDQSIKAIPAGPRGEPGEKGVDGKDGRDGTDGMMGVSGKDGAPGADGRAGERGEKGERGDRGEKGEPGQDGKPGQDGAEGKPGLSGKDGAAGRDGKDVDAAALAALVDEGIAKALPAAVQKAVDALMPDLIVKAAAAVPKPLNGIDGKDGRDGRDGVDGAPVALDVVRGLVDGALTKAVAELPKPKDGAPGKDADEAAIEARMTDKLARAVEAIPPPKDGRDGRDAPLPDLAAVCAKLLPMIEKPKDGRDGKDAEPVDVKAIVEAVVKQIPAPKDGARGQDGKSVSLDDMRPLVDTLFAKALPDWTARVEKAIADLPKPQAEDFLKLFQIEQAKSLLELERRAQDTLQRAIDKFPVPKDGKDALSVDDFSVAVEGRQFKFALKCGERSVERSITVPFPIYKGAFLSGQKSEEGDVYTFGGSLWIATKDTDDSPPSDNWKMMVRKGKDGKDARGE